jgi:hypothetical protein
MDRQLEALRDRLADFAAVAGCGFHDHHAHGVQMGVDEFYGLDVA